MAGRRLLRNVPCGGCACLTVLHYRRDNVWGIALLRSAVQTINLATTSAVDMDTGAVPASGYVAIYAICNPTTGAAALLATNATLNVMPSFYGGGLYSTGLVAVMPTNPSSQLESAFLRDRTVTFTNINALNSSTNQSSVTPLAISGIVSPNPPLFFCSPRFRESGTPRTWLRLTK
jgi:hypothetical protein